jgi:hypothetical protein
VSHCVAPGVAAKEAHAEAEATMMSSARALYSEEAGRYRRGTGPIVPLGKVMTRSMDTVVDSATLALQKRDELARMPVGLKVVGTVHATAPASLNEPTLQAGHAVDQPRLGLYVFAGQRWSGAPPVQ